MSAAFQYPSLLVDHMAFSSPCKPIYPVFQGSCAARPIAEPWPQVLGDPASLDARKRQERRAFRVALVTMPFFTPDFPSLQLGLLKPVAESFGFPVTNYHLNLDLVRHIGRKRYDAIADYRGRLLGEWLFSREAFGPDAPDPGIEFIEELERDCDALMVAIGMSHAEWLALRNEQIPSYLDRLAASISWDRFRVVGFTSTFQQNTPSIALARRIKECTPSIVTLFGGANFEGDMGFELVERVNSIDFAIQGEGEIAFREFLICLQEGRDPLSVQGVIGRQEGRAVSVGPAQPIEQLDDLPTPDFQEYYRRGQALGLLQHSVWQVGDTPLQTSRGCWWGQKHHCTFCGLNGDGIAFRAKSSERVCEELMELARRYHTFHFMDVGNIIDHKYFSSLFPTLVNNGTTYDFFFEAKANLGRQEVKLLREAGVRRTHRNRVPQHSHS